MYRITDEQHEIARVNGLMITPSYRLGKKIDVYRDGNLIHSIGDIDYDDYYSYLATQGRTIANIHRISYYNRHYKGIKKGHLGEVLSWILLWDGVGYHMAGNR